MTQLAVFNEQAVALASTGPGRFNRAETWGESASGRADYISTDKGMFAAMVNGQMVGQRVPSIEGVIVGQFPSGRDTGRTFFAGVYNPGVTTIPSCHSSDGKFPSADSKDPQWHSCNGCPKNAVGSGVTAGTRACRFNKTLAVAVPAAGDKVFALKISAQAIFAKKDDQGNYGFSAFDAALGSMVPQEVSVLFSQPEGSTGGVRFKPLGVFDTPTAERFVAISQLESTKAAIEEDPTSLNPALVAKFTGVQPAAAQPPVPNQSNSGFGAPPAAGGFGGGAAPAPAPAQPPATNPTPPPVGGFGTPGGFGVASDLPQAASVKDAPAVNAVPAPVAQAAAEAAGTGYNAALAAAFG